MKPVTARGEFGLSLNKGGKTSDNCTYRSLYKRAK